MKAYCEKCGDPVKDIDELITMPDWCMVCRDCDYSNMFPSLEKASKEIQDE